MEKELRFPLIMKNGAEVRTLSELNENFDIESIVGYFKNGNLVKWLSDRYYNDKADKMVALYSDPSNLYVKLCEILEVDYLIEDNETNFDVIRRRNEKYKYLSKLTDDQTVIAMIDYVALNQNELYNILDKNTSLVYLCGNKFEIPFGREKLRYIGVNSPLVCLGRNKNIFDFERNDVFFDKVKFERSAFVYPRPIGSFRINETVLVTGEPDNTGVCVVPNGITAISTYAFSNCKSLKKITLPDSITTIADGAFEDCENLTSITIPTSAIKIDQNAFIGCPKLYNHIYRRKYYNAD